MSKNPVILLTREPDDNELLKAHFTDLGWDVIEYPCIKTKIIPYNHEPISNNQLITDFSWVVFGSRRGVYGMKKVSLLLERGSMKLAAVGQSTNKAIKEWFKREADIVSKNGHSEELATLLLSNLKSDDTILNVIGTKSTGIIKQKLEQKGYRVDEVVVYENKEPDAAPLSLPDQVIGVFASPSAVHFFCKTHPDVKDKQMRWIAIGHTTAKAIKELGYTTIKIAETTDNPGIIKAIKSLI
jgi:uroporphyrinogen-III synthase